MASEVVGWRIVHEKHTRTAFSGEGARLFPGRWNSAGVRMVYCSENLALAALETLVHTRSVVLRASFRAFRVSWPERFMTTVELRHLPVGWNAAPPGDASQNIGDQWAGAGTSLALAVPSMIVPQERTFLVNPQHPDFRKIAISDAGPFVLDQRLL